MHEQRGSHRSHGEALEVGADAARLLELLERLEQDGHDPVSIAELRERGISAPAHAIYMLQLAGYPVARVRRGDQPGRRAYRLRAARARTRVPAVGADSR
jgi:hypothetical protein